MLSYNRRVVSYRTIAATTEAMAIIHARDARFFLNNAC